PNEPPLIEGHTFGSGEGSMEHTFELTNNVPSIPYDSPLIGGYTPGSDEGKLKLDELITLCTKLSKQVLDLEKEKDAQAVEILKLKKRVKKLERQRKSSILHLRIMTYKQVESSDADLDEEDASKQMRKSDKTKLMFKESNFDEIDDHMENVEGEKSKGKGKRVAFRDEEEPPRLNRSVTTLQPLPSIDPKDKGKGIMQESEPTPKNPREAQIQMDAEIAQRMFEEEQAQVEREQRIARERAADQKAKDAALID
ncbi:hypothetical protein Tco_0709734, partial [Tanacetum coccineum]